MESLRGTEGTCNVEGLGWFLRSGIDQGSGRLPKGCRGYLTRAADHAKPVTHGRVDQVGQLGQLGLAASANDLIPDRGKKRNETNLRCSMSV